MRAYDSFQKRILKLNAKQREAVDAIDGPVMVIAGPGTGKTMVLTLRIANILARTDTPPDAILALTFTESGAAEMKSRLASIIGTDAYRLTITTFHSFCNSVIRDYPEAFGHLAHSIPILESDQAVLVQELTDTTKGLELLRPVNAPDLYLKSIIGSINTLKREGVSPGGLVSLADADDAQADPDKKVEYQNRLRHNAKLRELSLLYTKYQFVLRKRRLYDYNDMVMEVARALEADEHLRLTLQEQHQYLLIDEHQDTNDAQNKVIELLASFWERPNLFVVGDAKQAIYRFQGASLANFLYFRNRYKDVKVVELEDSYRSGQRILDVAENIRPSSGTPLQSRTRHPGRPIRLMAFSTPDMQYWEVAREIAGRVRRGTAPDRIAVLARDNADVLAVVGYLARAAVPYTASTQRELTDDPFMHQLLVIFDAVRDFGKPGPLLKALHAPVLDIDPLDIYKLAEFCRSGRNPYDVMRLTALMHKAGIDGDARMRAVVDLLASWSRRALAPEAARALESIVSESGLLAAIVASPSALDTLAGLHGLYDMLRSRIRRDRDSTLVQFIDHLSFVRSRGITVNMPHGEPVPGRVHVITAHKSKGREFDVVYIIDAADGHWGSRNRRQLIRLPNMETGGDDEERNLFYVALTRARREVVITYSTHDADGAERLPAQYIADIRPSLISRADTAPVQRRWATEGVVRFSPAPQEPPPMSDRDYIAGLFERQGLSVTALNNYLSCPWRYFYTNLVRIPEAPTFALMYGNAVDRTLERYFNQLVAGRRGTRKDMMSLLEETIRDFPLQKVELATALARGRTALGGYFDRYHTEWHAHIINQLRISALQLDDGTMVNGKIDKLELLRESGTVRVVDYKTGKPKSRNYIIGAVKDGDGNYLRQLTFYKLLLDRWQNGKYRTEEGVIDFVEPDARGKWHRESFDITPASVRSLERDILRVADEIRMLSFWNRRCDDRSCPYC